MGGMTQIAERVNFALFHRRANGSAVRVGGRLAAAATGGNPCLTTTDGGSITVGGSMDHLPSGFVEVVGTKASDGMIDAAGVVPLGEQVDTELWEEAVKMAHLPALCPMFQPVGMLSAA